MGSTISTMILLVGTIVTGVLSSIAADGARTRNWNKTRIFSGVSLGTALTLVFLTLYTILTHHMLSGPGVMIALIFLILSTIGVAILDGIALAGSLSSEPEKTRAYGMTVGAAILSFGAFIVSLIIIIFLL